MTTWKEFITWEKASKETIDFKTLYVDIVGKRGVVGNRKNKKTKEIENGDIVSGLFLSQIIYWYLPSKSSSKKSKNGEVDQDNKLRVKKNGHYWIVKKPEEWYDEIRLTPANYRTAISRLEEEDLVIKKAMKDPFDEENRKTATHIRLNIPEFMRRWSLIMKENESQIQETDSDMNDYYEEQMREAQKKIDETKKQGEPLGHMGNVESTNPMGIVESTNPIGNVESTNPKGIVESTSPFITESTTEITTEITNKESIYLEEIKQLNIPHIVKRMLEVNLDKIDRLIRDNKFDFIDVELSFLDSKLNEIDFTKKLRDVLNAKNIEHSFASYLDRAIKKYISDSNNKIMDDQKEPVRKEMVPDFIREQNEEVGEPKEVTAVKIDLEMALYKMETEMYRSQLTEDEVSYLKQQGLWKEPVSA